MLYERSYGVLTSSECGGAQTLIRRILRAGMDAMKIRGVGPNHRMEYPCQQDSVRSTYYGCAGVDDRKSTLTEAMADY
jgi:hypothetical protein